MSSVIAVDLGATSGRVILGEITANSLALREVSRFKNGPVPISGTLRWDVVHLYANILSGMREAIKINPEVTTVGVDSWGVDYGLIRSGKLLGMPYNYRDTRTKQGVEKVHQKLSHQKLYERNGLQFLPFNSLYQFAAEQNDGFLDLAEQFLLIPDLINFWLGGEIYSERTNASTTGLLNVKTGKWDVDVIQKLGFSEAIFPKIIEPAAKVSNLLPSVADDFGGQLGIVSVASHDTASAVVAIPALDEDFAYISCGTWGLVGVELETPVLTEESRKSNFTNEVGVDGSIRYLHNVMGLWILNETLSTWEREGEAIDIPSLVVAAEKLSTSKSIFDPEDELFVAPGDMTIRITKWLKERNLPIPGTKAEWVRSIVESLAIAFAKTVHKAINLSGKKVNTIHIVGGGSQNHLLCKLTADYAQIKVAAGPVEATAIGNILIQGRANNDLSGGLSALRELVASVYKPVYFEPTSIK